MNEQNYANHVHRPTAWLVTFTGAVLALGLLVRAALSAPGSLTIGLVVLSLTAVSTVVLVRTFALRLQNRIVRLEMQVRLARLDREHDLAHVTMPQLVALRFASDAELPALLDRALGEQLSADAIKRAVTDWQGDHLRT